DRERESAVAAEARANANAELAQEERRRTDEQRQRAVASYAMAREALDKCMALKKDPRLKSGEMQELQKKLAEAEAGFYQKFVELRGEEPTFQAQRARAFRDFAEVTRLLGRPEEAIKHCEQAVALYEELAKREASQLARSELATSLGLLGSLYGDISRFADT